MRWHWLVVVAAVAIGLSVVHLASAARRRGISGRSELEASTTSAVFGGGIIGTERHGDRLVVVMNDGRVYVKTSGRAERPRLAGNYWSAEAVHW